MNIESQVSIKIHVRRQTMKINRFVALAVIALLVVGAMGAISVKVFAHSLNTPAAQTQPCDQEDDDSAEAQDAADTDDIEEECGDQNEADDQETEDAETGDAGTKGAEDARAVPAGVAVITIEQAEAAAIAAHPGTVTLTELEDEGGQWIYTVEFADGAEVEIDALTGTVLGTDSEQD
jgi:uncharacterized membrane protein YkoI